MSMQNFANHILGVAYQTNHDVTNLMLQKVMYYSMKNGVVNNPDLKEVAKEMYDEHFEVWRFGPVVPSVYQEFKGYGASVIPTIGHSINSEYAPFNKYIEDLLDNKPFDLVERSHQEKFWEDSPLNTKYPLEEVVREQR